MVARRRLMGLGVPTAVLGAALSLGLAPGLVGAVHEGDYPGHIHSGSCAELGDVVFPLGNARVGGMMQDMMGGMTDGSPEADAADAEGSPAAGMGMGERMGSEDAVLVATSYTLVDASLEDILAEEHAINYHESEENIENYIACGDLGGSLMTGQGMDDGGTLVVGLRAIDDSRLSGIATLEGMGDETAVTVYIAENLIPEE